MRRLAIQAIAVVAGAAGVFAQEYEAPELSTTEAGGSAMDWLFMAGFVIGCMVVAFLPCKRSNLQ